MCRRETEEIQKLSYDNNTEWLKYIYSPVFFASEQ